MPRVIRGRQTRPNPEVTSACDYWRVIPFLDSIISEMESRFAVERGRGWEGGGGGGGGGGRVWCTLLDRQGQGSIYPITIGLSDVTGTGNM